MHDLYTGTLSDYRYDTLLQRSIGSRSLIPLEPNDYILFRRRWYGGTCERRCVLGLADIVMTAGTTPHAEIVRLQREAHALLMLERKPTIKGYELLAAPALRLSQGGTTLFGCCHQARLKDPSAWWVSPLLPMLIPHWKLLMFYIKSSMPGQRGC